MTPSAGIISRLDTVLRHELGIQKHTQGDAHGDVQTATWLATWPDGTVMTLKCVVVTGHEAREGQHAARV